MGKKVLMATFLFVLLFVTLSGCTDLFNMAKEYVPTTAPGPSMAPVDIGKTAPVSAVQGVTITGNGRTITISGRGSYNTGSPQDYFTLNEGNASVSISLKGQGFGCSISLDYPNPYTGVTEFIPLNQFSSEERKYELSKTIYVPFATRYFLSVNWGGEWEIKITQ